MIQYIDNTSFTLNFKNFQEENNLSLLIYVIGKLYFNNKDFSKKILELQTYFLTPENPISSFFNITYFIETYLINDLIMLDSNDIPK